MEFLPKSILDSDDFAALEDGQQCLLAQRFRAISELATSLTSGERRNAANSFDDFVEDLELDAASIQEFDAASRGGISRWLIHYSWTSSCPPKQMRKAVPIGL